jgi:hypothetical protein
MGLLPSSPRTVRGDGPFGAGGLSIAVAATDDFTLTWTYTAAPSAIRAFCDVVVGY